MTMDQEQLRSRRLEAGEALAELLRSRAAELEVRGEANALWALLMRWAEAAAEEEVALGVEDAPSALRVLEAGEALAGALNGFPDTADAAALHEWGRLGRE